MSTMVERAEIPEHFWEAARSLRSAVLWESNSSVEHIALALLAAEKRGKEEERERCATIAETAETPEDGEYWIANRIAAAIRGS